jgi:predicted nucleic acid-binding protein
VRFVDTSFWFAVQSSRDANHEQARRLWAGRGPGELITSNHVVGETWTLLRRRAGYQAARRFFEAVGASSSIAVVRVDDATEDDAWRWLLRHDEREYSFVDATSFAVMRRRRIAEALAFDGDFSAAGFVEARDLA